MAGYTFPLYIENISQGFTYIAGKKTAVGDVAIIQEPIYKKRQEEIDDLLEYVTVDGKHVVKLVNQKRSQEVEKEKTDKEVESETKTVVGRFKDGKLHWQKAVGEIGKMSIVSELKALYAEGRELGLGDSSAVMKAIAGRIDVLLKPGDSRNATASEEE